MSGARRQRRARLAGAAVAVLLLGVPAGLVLAHQASQPDFPHPRHAGLFPLCTGCHTGIPQGDEAEYYPSPDLCARCHNGVDEETVEWRGPDREETNLTFHHPDHFAATDREGLAIACADCHSEPGAERMTIVERAEPATCFECHTHEAESHFEDAECSVCHVPLVGAPFDRARIDALPEPEDHEVGGWISEEGHGELAEAGVDRCSVCHTRDLCTACHVEAGLAPIQALAAAPADMELPEYHAEYPEPASHRSPSWLEDHPTQASVDACSTCHTQQDCAACHVAPLPDVVLALVDRAETEAPGVGLHRRMPASHASPFFTRSHGVEAASGRDACATCHTPTFCTDCHDAPQAAAGEGLDESEPRPVAGLHGETETSPGMREGGFHPPNFMTQHASDAYGRTLDCADCHNTAVFCRACHQEAGFETAGRLGQGFHDAQPLWLLRHGQAARQALESCTSCHNQTDCLQCHSTTGAFRVNPHTRDFDARQAWEANPVICFACHLKNPFEGGGEIP